MNMTRNSLALAFVLAFASGCTITTNGGSRAASPESHEHASNAERPRRHRPAKPRRVEDPPTAEKPAEPEPKPPLTTPAKPEPRPDTKPVIARPKPEPRPDAKPPETKPKPEPRPETKPPETKPKPEPKPPETKPKPEPKPPETKPKPEPRPTKPKPEPKPPVEKGIDGFVFGKPDDIKAGARDAYYVYQDETGWHLRTTTAGTIWRTFKGRISITQGKFTAARRVTKQAVDGFQLANQNIQFDFKTSVGIDGIDFESPDARCVQFELSYESRLDPKVIRIGAKGITPAAATFTICKP
jgi:hypothetical protein